MTDQERSELERLKQRQSQLQEQLTLLSRELKALEIRLALAPPIAAPQVPLSPPEAPRFAPELPKPASPQPVPPPVIQPSATPVFARQQPESQIPLTPPQPPTLQAPASPRLVVQSAPPPRIEAPPTPASFEMRLGTYWLVRIGIVMLLTGLVFFGNYAYQNFIIRFGPMGKITLLYLAGGILLGAGAWWQRKQQKESLKNYAQVLFAGGLATIYFTTYAAHHIRNLKVIESPLLDGVLLLGWAGFIVWLADRKKSELLALFAIGLAYYTSIITRVGQFTLYSNLILTVAAVFFLVRNRWATLSYVSVVATYAGYAFWRFVHGGDLRWETPGEGLWIGSYFLMSYWVVFSAAVFLSKHEKLVGGIRASFLTLNNGAFFSLFLLTMLQVHHGGFWKFSTIYGAVLLGLAALASRVLAAEKIVKNSYLTQGLLLVTIGLITKYSGLQLALILAAESVVLLTLGDQRKNLILQIGAYITAALSVAWGIDGMKQTDLPGLYLGSALGGLMTFNACWSAGRDAQATTIRPRPAYFTVLALLAWLITTWDNTTRENLPLVLATEALLFTVSIYSLRVREITLFGQGYLVLGQLLWLFDTLQNRESPPWWNPALMIAITLGLSHWWQRQKVLDCARPTSQLWQGLYALAIIGVLYQWLSPNFAPPLWLALTSLLAVGITAYGLLTRSWLLAGCGQVFLFVSGWEFVRQLWEGKPDWYVPLAPILTLALLPVLVVEWFARTSNANTNAREPLLRVGLVYRWTALIMSLWWVWEYIPARERFWFLAVLGLLAFLWAGWRRNQEALLFSAAFALTGLATFWLPLHEAPTVYLPNLLAILVLLAKQQLAKRFPENFRVEPPLHAAMIVVGGLSLWLFLSRWVLLKASGFYLTASWSALALVLFTCGIVMRERMYRWLGLAVLASALGRVVIFDVWKLETIYRVLSFMALGVVLLVLGFLYNKYQEKIKEWL